MELTEPKKRKQFSHARGPGSAQLVNALSVERACSIRDRELKDWSEINEGCTTSTRKVDIGDYPRMTLTSSDLSGTPYADLESRLRRVNITHLVLRASGNTLPPYEDNLDVMHSCHRGKARTKDDKCCITLEHLSIGTHKENMKSQNCPKIFKCPFCKLLSQCGHVPPCVGDPASEKQMASQRKPKKIAITYEDGTVEEIAL